MVVMAGESEIGIDTPGQLRPPAIGIVIIAGLYRARAVGQFANRTEMIASVVVICRTNLLALCVKAFRDVIACVPFLTWLRVAKTPDELLGAGRASIILLDDLNALTNS